MTVSDLLSDVVPAIHKTDTGSDAHTQLLHNVSGADLYCALDNYEGCGDKSHESLEQDL